MLTPIRKHPDVEIDAAVGQHRIVHHRSVRKYFKLGVREADFLAALDGSRDAPSLRAHPPGGFSPEQVDFLLNWLSSHGLLAGAGAGAANAPRAHWGRRLLGLANPDRWQVTLCDPDRFLERHLDWVHACFSRAALLVYLIVLCLPIMLYTFAPALFAHAPSLARTVFSLPQWLAVYGAMLAMIALHEMAHAVACKHYGGAVRKIGVKLLYLQPVVFCDVSASWRFREVDHKVMVSAAGIFIQLVVSCAVVAAWTVLRWPTLWYFAALNVAIALFNLFPFVRLDGYWILVHLLDQPDLMKRGRAALDAMLVRVAGRMPRHGMPDARLALFGLACRIAAIGFWLTGLVAVRHYAGMLAPALGNAVMALFGVLMLGRALQAGAALLADFHAAAKA